MEKLEMEDDAQRGHADRWYNLLFNRRILRTIATALGFIVILKFLWSLTFQTYLPIAPPSDFYLQRGAFEWFPVNGFVNTGDAQISRCEDLRHGGGIQIQESVYLDTDLRAVADQLKDHPLVTFHQQAQKLTYDEMVERSLSRAAGSSVWLEKYKVHLSATRIIFHAQNNRSHPIISFLWGQLYDRDWNEKNDHTIKWQGEPVTFPTIFDVTTPFSNEGASYGPHDPQIVVEDDVDGAEPVIIFSMLTNLGNPERAMHLFRPFTNDLTILTTNGDTVRAVADKTWVPFFYHPQQSSSVIQQKWPSNYIHLVDSYTPLRIFKCHLLTGHCQWTYEQDIPDGSVGSYNNSMATIQGGTNLVSIPMKGASGTTSFIGFVRNQVTAGCSQGPMSTPQFVIMTVSRGSHFHLDFVSDPVDFGSALLSQEALADPCGEGRTLLAHGISRWDRTVRQDVMTVTFSVDTSTIKTMRIHGLLSYVNQLPYLRNAQKYNIKADGEALWDSRWSIVGNEALVCALEVAQVYSVELAASVSSVDSEDDIEQI